MIEKDFKIIDGIIIINQKELIIYFKLKHFVKEFLIPFWSN
jgi:hypothetical protein